MQQKVTTPTAEDLDRLNKQRAVIEAFIADESRARYDETAAGKLGALRALLEANVFRPDQTYELQCLGIVLGDAFVQELGLEWVTVEDDYGRDPALRVRGTAVLIFPLTMISKRVERSEAVDVFDLFNGVASQIDQIRKGTSN